MTHWIDVVHWYMNVEAPISAYSSGKNYNQKMWEAPDTVTTTLEFPNNFTCAYLGTYVSRVDDGGLEFRGELGTLKIDRARLAFYKDDAPYAKGTLTPEPEIVIPSKADGSIAHLQNWIDCVRSRQTAERAHPRRPPGGADVAHRQRVAARRQARTLEQRRGANRELRSPRPSGLRFTQDDAWPTSPSRATTQDLSSQRGFQFKFFCQKCGNGYMSSFQTNSLGMAGAAMDAAASLLGGIFGRAAQTADQLAGDGGRTAARFRARRRREGDLADLQAVHAVRAVGVRADLLEQEGRALRGLRARSRRGDRGGAGPGRARAGDAEGAGGRLHEASATSRSRPPRCVRRAERRRRAASSVPSAGRRSARSAPAPTAAPRPKARRSSARSAATSYGP